LPVVAQKTVYRPALEACALITTPRRRCGVRTSLTSSPRLNVRLFGIVVVRAVGPVKVKSGKIARVWFVYYVIIGQDPCQLAHTFRHMPPGGGRGVPPLCQDYIPTKDSCQAEYHTE